MASIILTEEKLDKVLTDVEVLIEDVASLFDQTELAQKRMAEVKIDPSIGKTEQELDAYLKKRGVQIDGMGN